jgi:kinesin family member 11
MPFVFRVKRQTHINMNSSRSHTIFQISVEKNKVDENGMLKRAKINLCDLAGSEKVYNNPLNLPSIHWVNSLGPKKKNKHFEELKNINLSLSTLGMVIAALALKSAHIPYRESKLTRLLQDSIGGSAKCALIATISPTA